jgi:CubicO group peptidase (beta-lactamase class C family)
VSSWGASKRRRRRPAEIKNHNPKGFTPRGLGFGVGKESGSPGCSEQTFGHTGSTGTLCWADPVSETICVVLTSLPRRVNATLTRTRGGVRRGAVRRRAAGRKRGPDVRG